MVALLLILACASEPDPCLEMCRAAEALYGGCLDGWAVDWTAAGYADADEFTQSCETWAWEMRLLEDEAGEPGGVDDTCISRAAIFSSEDATCDDYTGIDWSEAP